MLKLGSTPLEVARSYLGFFMMLFSELVLRVCKFFVVPGWCVLGKDMVTTLLLCALLFIQELFPVAVMSDTPLCLGTMTRAASPL